MSEGYGEKFEYDALLDSLILETLKRNSEEGLTVYGLQETLRKDHPELGLAENSRTTLKRRLKYLRALGEETGLFMITANHEESEKAKGRERYKYFNIMRDSAIQAMLRSDRAIKGKPLEKKTESRTYDEETGRRRLVRSSRQFFTDLTSEELIHPLDIEYPPEMRNPKMMNNIEVIYSAIHEKKVLNVRYGDYNINGQLCTRRDENGKEVIAAYPIRMVVVLGRYYLYCRRVDSDNISCMRIDRIISCAKTENTFDWEKENGKLISGNLHFAQRLYMYTGSVSTITFLTDERHINDVFDWFGSKVKLSKTEDNMVSVTVHADKTAMLYWAMQYSRYVRVIDPPELVEMIKQALEEALNKYS